MNEHSRINDIFIKTTLSYFNLLYLFEFSSENADLNDALLV